MLMALPVKAALLAGLIAGPVIATHFTTHTPNTDALAPATVTLAVAPFDYRAAGEFSLSGKPAEPPKRVQRLAAPLTIMTRQVTAAEYERCVADRDCARLDARNSGDDRPAVGVSWHDATAYAHWLSKKSGRVYRLPTDEEWTYAAAEHATEDTVPIVDPADPAQGWIARYEIEAARDKLNPAPQPAGTFGTNSHGLKDIAGNVWEWTDSCFVRATLDGGQTKTVTTNCGVRVVQGAHRTYMTDFIRDPRTGGCAAGVPPTNLGFRLVMESPTNRTPLVATIRLPRAR